MSVEWNYFKNYKIEPENEYPFENVIKYVDGGSLGFGYSTSANLGLLLKLHGATVPVYHWAEPPKSKKLDLIEPYIVVEACNKSLELLEKEENPILKYDGPLFDKEDLEDEVRKYKDTTIIVPSKRKVIIEHLKIIKKLSKEGYYFVKERE